MLLRTTSLLVASLALPAAAQAEDAYELSWSGPAVYVQGDSYWVELEVKVGEDAVQLPLAALSAAAFAADEKPLLADAPAGQLDLGAGSEMSLRLDLGGHLAPSGDFVLSCAGRGQEIAAYAAAPAGPEAVDYMQMEADQLGQWLVLMETNRGPLVLEFWPEVAPNHVRNFLDLAQTGFYEGILFHRIIPGFVLQAGCPRTKDPENDPRIWGLGTGPRAVNAEFNDRPHVRGVLSMARSGDPNSATSQFFLCHGEARHLDGQYTGFGRLVQGLDTLDRIAETPTATDTQSHGDGERHRTFTDRPAFPQRIERTLVVRPLSPKQPSKD